MKKIIILMIIPGIFLGCGEKAKEIKSPPSTATLTPELSSPSVSNSLPATETNSAPAIKEDEKDEEVLQVWIGSDNEIIVNSDQELDFDGDNLEFISRVDDYLERHPNDDIKESFNRKLEDLHNKLDKKLSYHTKRLASLKRQEKSSRIQNLINKEKESINQYQRWLDEVELFIW
jgi:hypothetical protein